MFKKILALVFCVCLIFAVGCSDSVVYDDLSNYGEGEQAPTLEVNPLTGINDVSKKVIAQRPVAVVVNNISVAQKVQTGLSNADIIYETEAEGGITRLLAVYQDISKVDKVGTVRSARCQHIELAMGHNAVYIHCGQNVYAKQLLDNVDHLNVETNKYGGERVKNGMSSTEHTLYVNTDKLLKSIDEKFDIKAKSVKPFANFADEKETLNLDGGTATSIKVNFPTKDTDFTYDSETGLYTRLSDEAQLTDYYTKEETKVKNVFVLLTEMSHFADNYTRKVSLQGGDGYYMTNGTVQFIKWSKGNATDSFKFTDTEGNEIKVSAGNSWICIADKATCTPTIK